MPLGDRDPARALPISTHVPGHAYNVRGTNDVGLSSPESHESRPPCEDSGLIPEESNQLMQSLKLESNVSTEIDQLTIRVDELEKRLANSEKDNRTLRSIIFRLRSPPQQSEDDGFYVMKLNSLDVTIERWIAHAFKAEVQYYLSDDDEHEIRRLLDLYKPGRALIRFMSQNSGYSIRAMHSNSFQRIVLVRHIVALCLWAHVFKPICFGIADEVNRVMSDMVNYVISTGNIVFNPSFTNLERDYSKVLSFRQALGRGLCDRAQAQALLPEPSFGVVTKNKLVAHIERLIEILLPREHNIRPGIQKTVDVAIDLAYKMTSEQAMFNCEMVLSGEPEKENYTSAPDDGEKGGRVYVCVFPFFGKRVMEGSEGSETLQVVKLRSATVIYEREIKQSFIN